MPKEIVQIQAEFLFQLENKHQWICRAPYNLNPNEKYVWIDKNGNAFARGMDFTTAEKIKSFPCKVYRLITVTEAITPNSAL
jgi:hypothetical protein